MFEILVLLFFLVLPFYVGYSWATKTAFLLPLALFCGSVLSYTSNGSSGGQPDEVDVIPGHLPGGQRGWPLAVRVGYRTGQAAAGHRELRVADSRPARTGGPLRFGRSAAAAISAILVLVSAAWLGAALLKANLRSGHCTDADPSTCQGVVGNPTAELLLALVGIFAALAGAGIGIRYARTGRGADRLAIPRSSRSRPSSCGLAS